MMSAANQIGARAKRRPPQPRPTSAIVVRRLWPESTVVVIGSGPSLTPADVDFCCGRARVIVVNDAYRLAPWADALYACDSRWWHWHKGVPDFHGQKYALQERARHACPSLTILRDTGDEGLELNPSGVKTGRNSGYQAINLAVHLGARKIVLLGFDCKPAATGEKRVPLRHHFFGEHPHPFAPPYHLMRATFPTLVAPLAAIGVEIVNATASTALDCFPRRSLADALGSARLVPESLT